MAITAIGPTGPLAFCQQEPAASRSPRTASAGRRSTARAPPDSTHRRVRSAASPSTGSRGHVRPHSGAWRTRNSGRLAKRSRVRTCVDRSVSLPSPRHRRVERKEDAASDGHILHVRRHKHTSLSRTGARREPQRRRVDEALRRRLGQLRIFAALVECGWRREHEQHLTRTHYVCSSLSIRQHANMLTCQHKQHLTRAQYVLSLIHI